MAFDPGTFYDEYWAKRDRSRTEARSRERAALTLELLQGGGVSSGRLLDAGCGPGWTLEAFKAAGYEAVGVDAAGAAVEEARSRGLDARRLDLEGEDPSAALEEYGRFEAIVVLEVLEHLADPLGALLKLRGLLGDTGRIVASLPNEITLPARLRALCGRLPFGGHDDPHLRHFDRGKALRLFEAAGLRVAAERRISIVPPRWKAVRAVTAPLPRLLPGAFAIASVYLLTPWERPNPHAE